MSASVPYRTPTISSEVQDYVLSETNARNRAPHTLLINVSHSNFKQTRFLELRIDASTLIDSLKGKLYKHTGTRPDSMTILLSSSEKGRPIRADLSNEIMSLASYGVISGDWLYIVDSDPHSASAGGRLEDTSLIPKYELSEEKYATSDNTYRAYKRKMREKDPKWSMTSKLAKELNKKGVVDYSDGEPAANLRDRCEVNPGGKRGQICFAGKELQCLPADWWIGVRYDEPVGKNDGFDKGVRYFEALKGYGGLVRPSLVKVGEFPLRDDFHSEDEINGKSPVRSVDAVLVIPNESSLPLSCSL